MKKNLSYGPVPRSAMRAALAAPAGQATTIIRAYVPSFGKLKGIAALAGSRHAKA